MLLGILLLFILLSAKRAAIQGTSPPGKPRNVSLFADTNNIAVAWETPERPNGNIRKFTLSWAIMPNFTDTNSAIYVDESIDRYVSLVPIGGNVGRLYRLRVRAENPAGIGPYSLPRFIRTGCGRNVILEPYKNVSIASPGFDSGQIKSGVLCLWTITTREMFTLTLRFDTIDINAHKTENFSLTCNTTSVRISGFGILCNTYVKPIMLNSTNSTIILKTGISANGRGVRFSVSSKPMLPGPPTNIAVNRLAHGIEITWQQPIENILNITSYFIKYTVVSLRRTFKVHVSSTMRRFAVSTKRYEGKLLEFAITALTGQIQGQWSMPRYVRAPCHTDVMLLPGHIQNISSPNYPSHYPSDIICTWNVTMVAAPETMLHVRYLDFRLEDTPLCSSDYLLFSFKTTMEPECAMIKLPKTTITKEKNFTIKFVTDSKNEYAGFLIQIESEVLTSTTVSSTTFPMPTRRVVSRSSKEYSTVVDSPKRSTSSIQTISSISRRITSPVTVPPKKMTTYQQIDMSTRSPDSYFIYPDKNRSRIWTYSAGKKIQYTKSDRGSAHSTYSTPGVIVVTPHAVANITEFYKNTSQPTHLLPASERPPETSVVFPVILSVACTVAMLVLIMLIYTLRSRRNRTKVHSEILVQRKKAKVELYDILCQLHSEKGSGQSWSQSNVTYQCTGCSRKPTRDGSTRKRCYSFPLAHLRKHHKQIEKRLSKLSFIDDKAALENNLQRIFQHHRTNSF